MAKVSFRPVNAVCSPPTLSKSRPALLAIFKCDTATNLCCFVEEVGIAVTGDTVAEVEANFKQAFEEYKEVCKEAGLPAPPTVFPSQSELRRLDPTHLVKEIQVDL